MPSRRQTRGRQLAKLAARRAAERQRKRRQRLLAISIAMAAALGGLIFAVIALAGGSSKPVASPTKKPTPGPTAAPTPTVLPVACGGTVPTANSVKKPQFKKPPKTTIDTRKKYLMTMETSCGTIKIELDPNTAGGGDPATFGTGGPGYKTVDTPPSGAKYPAGTVAMAKGGSEANGTAGRQFFIVTGSNADQSLAPGGQGQYAIVGKVISGLDIAQEIEKLPRQGGTADGRPAEDVYIVKVTV